MERPNHPEITRLAFAERVIRSADREHPADAVLRGELKAQHGLSRVAAAEVSRAVFTFYRWHGWLDQARPIEAQLSQALGLAGRFSLEPESFPDSELVSHAVPGWVGEEMDVTPAWVRALQAEPRLWLRARLGQGSALATKLGEGCVPFGPAPHFETAPPPLSSAFPAQEERVEERRRSAGSGEEEPAGGDAGTPGDILEYRGAQDLFRTAEFHAGEFEVQDITSQAVGLVSNPQPGETWWDACAGEGGKLLHLSDLMQNKGLIWASDRAAWRLQRLKRRCARAGAFNYRSAPWDGGPKLPTKTRFDGVLLDAPCSGVGTWHRNPHARWTTTAQDVSELAELQVRLLANASSAVKPGGKLVYAVCTLTHSETHGVVKAFETRFPDFEPSAFSNPLLPGEAAGSVLCLRPQDFGGNGMFIACWRRK